LAGCLLASRSQAASDAKTHLLHRLHGVISGVLLELHLNCQEGKAVSDQYLNSGCLMKLMILVSPAQLAASVFQVFLQQ